MNNTNRWAQISPMAVFSHTLTLGANYIFNRRDFFSDGRPLYWNEGQANAGLSVPLNLSKGRSYVNLTIGSDYVIKTVSYSGAYKDSLDLHHFADNCHLGYINGYISFTHQVQQARKNIYPRLAQSIYIELPQCRSNRICQPVSCHRNILFPGFCH